MTTVYLATMPCQQVVDALQDEPAPALLVSFAFWDKFAELRDRIRFRSYCLDSGAFSAFNSGKPVDLDAYIRHCQQVQQTDDGPTEIFSLDVIGDWRASARNTKAMWKAGVQAIPTYHFGEPESVLVGLARDYPKIALGGHSGVIGGPGKIGFHELRENWFDQCVARVWPKRIHAFGIAIEKLLLKIPFHSADSSAWQVGPNRFGKWMAYGKDGHQGRMQTKGSHHLRPEVVHYLKFEARLKTKWKKELAKL